MRVLIVDDSVVFRSQIKASLENVPGIEVVGTANNGKIALQKIAQSSVDLITLDMEMPEMGGIETIKEIKKARYPLRIIVFSSHTVRGSEAALEALACGADDFVAKPTGEGLSFENAAERIRGELLPKVIQFIPKDAVASTPVTPLQTGVNLNPGPKSSYPHRDIDTFLPNALVIASSTGGPPALEKALVNLPKPFRLPIFIAQHMPPFFTTSLAKRLKDLTGIPTAEAKNGEIVENNHIYIAPGDFHMKVIRKGLNVSIVLDQNPQRNSVRPAADFLFESAAEVYTNRTMGFVLTGMGEDGLVGARCIKEKGGGIMIQNRESSVVFGMPGAIFSAGFQDDMGDLSRINSIIRRMGS